MAIHDNYPSLEVRIIVNGQSLPEYDDKDASTDSNIISKYVKTQAGSEFGIAMSLSSPLPAGKDVKAEICIDGTSVRKVIAKKTQLTKGFEKTTFGLKAQEKGKWVIRKFTFAELNICELNLPYMKLLVNELRLTNQLRIAMVMMLRAS